jgi:hypothetical protein
MGRATRRPAVEAWAALMGGPRENHGFGARVSGGAGVGLKFPPATNPHSRSEGLFPVSFPPLGHFFWSKNCPIRSTTTTHGLKKRRCKSPWGHCHCHGSVEAFNHVASFQPTINNLRSPINKCFHVQSTNIVASDSLLARHLPELWALTPPLASIVAHASSSRNH